MKPLQSKTNITHTQREEAAQSAFPLDPPKEKTAWNRGLMLK
jgi:hypothetical protein